MRDTYCSHCGASFGGVTTYPRTCAKCATTLWANPIPVSIVLVPIRKDGAEGILCARRTIEPKKGLLSLTGGFLEEHETWQQGGAREVREETQVHVDPATLTSFWFTSTQPRPNRVLLFSLAPALDAATALKPFVPSNETVDRGLVFGPDGLDALFAFDLHVEAIRRYFASRGISGPNRFTLV